MIRLSEVPATRGPALRALRGGVGPVVEWGANSQLASLIKALQAKEKPGGLADEGPASRSRREPFGFD
jgi:hypothetical protein